MNTQRLRLAILLVVLLVLPDALFARLLPQWSIGEEIAHAELIIQGHLTGPEQVVVERVFVGPSRPSETIPVESLSELPREVFKDEADMRSWFAGDPMMDGRTGKIVGGKRKPRPTIQGHPVVLFLVRNRSTGRWFPYSGSGVKWLLGDAVYSYQQLENPGPYVLLPDREVKTAADLYRTIQEGIKKRSR